MAPARFKGAPKAKTRPINKLSNDRNFADKDADDEILEKDETEARLEKLLFGDEAGFLEALKPHEQSQAPLSRVYESKGSGAEDGETDDFDAVPDDELFFLDSGVVGPSTLPQTQGDSDLDEEDYANYSQPAWQDSDDDRFSVSLASNTRLRKLRNAETEDVISGREYILRLRRQYEILHPKPQWAKQAIKRKRFNGAIDEENNSASDSDVSIDESSGISSAQPLAELLRSAGSLVRLDSSNTHSTKLRKLRPQVIDIQRTKDVAQMGPSAVDTLDFHPYYPLLLSAGPSSTVSLHHISPHTPNPNPLLTVLHLKGTPLTTAAFCPSAKRYESTGATEMSSDTTRIFLSSRRRYFHSWSLSLGKISKISRPLYGSHSRNEQRTMESFRISPCGQYMGLVGSARKGGGSVNVIDTTTMQWVCSCRIDSTGGVADFAFWGDGEGISVVGKNGEVSEYHIGTRRVLGRWVDEGAVGTTVISIGGSLNGRDRWAAIGSSSGIVNIYDRKDWSWLLQQDSEKSLQQGSQRPKPVRTLDQLTTPISNLVFSIDGQMLVMASRWKRDALRLVHLPSCTVYQNWPTDKTPLGRISSVAISSDGGILAVGNEQGGIRLWEIRA